MDNTAVIHTGANSSGAPLAPAQPPPGATFDAPLTQATSLSNLSQNTTTGPAQPPPGATFDAPLSAPTSLADLSQVTPAQKTPNTPTTLSDVVNALDIPGNLTTGALHGMADSGAGAIGIIERMANPSGDPANEQPWLREAKTWLQNHAQNSGTDVVSRGTQIAGKGIEGLGEWLLGDEALKGASLSERLLTSGKIAKTIESSPRLTAVVKAGIQALGRGAVIGGTQGALKSGGAPGATVGGAVAGAVGNVLIPGAINTAKELPALFDTLKGVIKPCIIQDEFQNGIRGLLNDAAQEAGVAPSGASSIRDVANDVSTALQSKAKAAYQALDDATGGRVQRFSDSIKTVQQKLRNLNGIATPDDEGAWVEKLNDLQDAHEKALQEAEAAGVPRALLDQANANYRQSMAMSDLNRAIRSSAEGLRPELASGANKPLPEKVNTGKLFGRVNKLYDSGRLQDAIGDQRSGDLLRATNDAHAASQTAQNVRNLAGSAAKHILRPLYYGATWELLKHLFGE